MTDHTINIEPDNINDFRCMIVVKDPRGYVLSVPARNLTYQAADSMLPFIRVAFEHGAREGRRIATMTISRTMDGVPMVRLSKGKTCG